MISIIEALDDSRIFGQLLKDPSTWATWRVALKAMFALPMNAIELKTYRKYTGRKKPPAASPQETYFIVGRRGGKSLISAIVAVFLAIFHDWNSYLSKGERGFIMCIAADRFQAKVILSYIKGILELPVFSPHVKKVLSWEIHLRNNIIISIKTCDFRTLRGFTVLSALLDELAFWRYEGLNPAREILTALRPAMATIPGAKLIGISSPFARAGVLYEMHKKFFSKEDSEALIWQAPTRAMNPTILQSKVDLGLIEDPIAAKSEWLAEFRADLETFLPVEIIEAAVIGGRYMLPCLPQVDYVAFTDPSGGRADSFTLAIAHKDDKGRIVLDRVEERKPPFAPREVVEDFSNILKEYRLHSVVGDKYAGEWVTSAFQDEGINYENSPKDKSSLYLEFQPLMMQRTVELLDHRKLIEQLRSLEQRTRSGGRDLVDHGPGAHDDIANSVAGACVLVSSGAQDEIYIGFSERDFY